MIKLKRNLQYKGHQYFQAVRSHVILQTLEWLKALSKNDNPHYQTITINPQNIDETVNIHFVKQNQTDATSSCTESVDKNYSVLSLTIMMKMLFN